MNEPDKTKILRPLDETTKASLIGGSPLAIITVWAIENFALPPGTHLDATVAIAFGTVGTVFFGELWLTFKRFLNHLSE